MIEKFSDAPRMRLYEYVSEEIEKAITEKKILPGEKLPSENGLAEQFNVSRTIVREALKILTERRLITVEDGKGAYVLSPTPEESIKALSRYIARLDMKESYEPLFEMRLMIEPDLAYLAALRADEKQILKLQKGVDDLKLAQEDPEKWIETDLEFHSTIAEAAHNPYAIVFIETLLEHMDFLVGSGFLLEGAIEATIDFHEDIFESIKSGEPAKAKETMRDHILQSQNRLEQAFKIFHKGKGSKR